MFEYCVYYLHFSEAAAYRRIRAARAVQKHREIGVFLREGRLNLETITLLHPFLDEADIGELIQKAAGLRTWQVQALVANRKPEETRRDVIRYCGPKIEKATQEEPPAPLFAAAAPTPALGIEAPLEAPHPPQSSSAPAPTGAFRPSSVRVTFSADDGFYKLLLRAQALLRHKYPDGRLEGVLKDALIALLRKKDLGFRWAPAKAARR